MRGEPAASLIQLQMHRWSLRNNPLKLKLKTSGKLRVIAEEVIDDPQFTKKTRKMSSICNRLDVEHTGISTDDAQNPPLPAH